MRIAVVGTRGIGVSYSGIETSVTEIYPRLVRKGHQVHVFARGRFRGTLGGEYEGVRVEFRPSVNSKYLDTITHVLACMPSAIFGAYDIVHFHALGPSIFSFLPRLCGRRTVVTVHGLDWKRSKWNAGGRAVLKLGETASARFPDATIVVSEELKRHYDSLGCSNLFYVPNGVSPAGYAAPEQIRELGLEKEGYVLFVARLTPEKGAHVLLDAWARVKTRMKLVIAGDNPFDSGYVRKLRAAAGANVVFTGFQTGKVLGELYSNAYLYVQPSEIEGLPIALLEAMSYGRCAVVSDIPENLEAAGESGMPFKCNDAAGLAVVLQTLLGDPERVRTAGAAARTRALERYNWDRIAEETLAVYEKLVSA